MDALPIFTIFHNASDYPGLYVVRRYMIQGNPPKPVADQHLTGMPVKTLDEARLLIPPGMICIPRDKRDETQIVESWF